MSAGKCRELPDALTVVPLPGMAAVASGSCRQGRS